MSVLVFTIILLLGAYAAGLLGSLTGLGGGVIVIPLLTLAFGIDFHYAIGAALVASIATSSGSASAYVKEGMTNIRLGMFLEIATSVGAVLGAVIALWMPTNVIAVIFGVVLFFTAVMQNRQKVDHVGVKGSALAMKLKLFGSYPTKEGVQNYELTNVPGGFLIMVVAHWQWCVEGVGDGFVHEGALQSEHHDEQFHDWCDGGNVGCGLFTTRLYRAGHRFSHHGRCVGWCTYGCKVVETPQRQFAEKDICCCHFVSGCEYDL